MSSRDWISVKKLPELNLLKFSNDVQIRGGGFNCRGYYDGKRKKWYLYGAYDMVFECAPTHWKPL